MNKCKNKILYVEIILSLNKSNYRIKEKRENKEKNQFILKKLLDKKKSNKKKKIFLFNHKERLIKYLKQKKIIILSIH